MSSIKLTYFDTKGRGEIARIILAYAGVRYTDERVKMGRDLSGFGLPFGQLPVLTYKGTVMAQSMTIARFLAKEFGLAGFTPMETAKVDEVIDSISDIMTAGIPAFFSKDPKVMEEYIAKLMEYFGRMEALLQSRGGQFLVGNALTWADLMLFTFVDMMKDLNPTLLEKFAGLSALMETVQEIPNIKKWIKNRPEGFNPLKQ